MRHQFFKYPIIYFCCLFFAFAITSCVPQFTKLSESKTDTIKIDIADKMVSSYFSTLKAGDSYNFNNIATEVFCEGMTPQVQKQSYNEIVQHFGSLQSLSYSSTWVDKEIPQIEIIRFKGYFEKSTSPLEIRVIINNDNKISGFWIKPWIDNLNDY